MTITYYAGGDNETRRKSHFATMQEVNKYFKGGEMNYTKGEWKVMQGKGEILIGVSELEGAIASLRITPINLANANLIAASPMMYEALVAFNHYLDAAPPQNMRLKKLAFEKLEKALSKAEGKGD